MKCKNCGTENPNEMLFCGRCGAKLVEEPQEHGIKEENHTENINHISSIFKKIASSKRNKIIMAVVAVLIVFGGVLWNATSLTSGEKEAVNKVYTAIDAIGPVSLGSEKQISNAEGEYSKLEKKLQWHVKNRGQLTAARKDYDQLRAKEVNDLINSIGQITIEKNSTIFAARDLYSRLNSNQAKLVKDYKNLQDAEAKLIGLQKRKVGNYINRYC